MKGIQRALGAIEKGKVVTKLIPINENVAKIVLARINEFIQLKPAELGILETVVHGLLKQTKATNLYDFARDKSIKEALAAVENISGADSHDLKDKLSKDGYAILLSKMVEVDDQGHLVCPRCGLTI